MSIYQQHKPSSGEGIFLRLKDGDKVKLRIASDPVITVYKAGDKPRYAWLVYNRNDKKAQVYNAGVSVYNQIADLTEEWGEPTEFDITIKRTGSGLQDTEYSVVPVKNSDDLTQEQEEEINKLNLRDLTKGKWLSEYVADKKLPEPIMGSEPELTDDDAPISLDDVPDFN
jgi:hypothetical protein